MVDSKNAAMNVPREAETVVVGRWEYVE